MILRMIMILRMLWKSKRIARSFGETQWGVYVKPKWFKKWYYYLWWRFMPGTEIKVRWPVGKITVDHNDPRWVDLGGAVWVELESADPNDHYRPELTEKCGRQGWDWQWDLRDNDAAENKLTVKIRRGKSKYASYFALKWS